MKRSPVSNCIAPKRKLEDDFDDKFDSKQSNESSLSKKMNTSSTESRKDLSLFDKNMFEAEYKAQLIKITSLEQELTNSKNEKKSLESEFEIFKRKKAEELRDAVEVKKDLEKSLKLCKTNENFLKSENERLGKVAEEAEATRLPEKEKEISLLKKQIETLIEENRANSAKYDKEISNLKYDLESKTSELEQVESDLARSKESIEDISSKFEAVKKENCQFQNQIRDLESQVLKLQDNTSDLNKYIDQSMKIENLEREHRNLLSKLEYSKKNEQDNHLLQEDLNSKNKQIERYEKRIVTIELENENLKETIQNINETKAKESNNDLIDQLKQQISCLDLELIKNKEKSEGLDSEIRQLKKIVDDKNSYIDQVHKQFTRSNTERNCYKNMINECDFQVNTSENEVIKQLEKRIEQYEIMLSYYKSQQEPIELKMCNNNSMRLYESDSKSISVQVNLNSEIYSNYETTIEKLRNKIEELSSSSMSSAGNSYQSKEVDESQEKEFFFKEFEKKSKTILRACSQLLGFKVSFHDSNKVSLASLKCKENIIQFKINANNSLALVETRYLDNFKDYVDKYLKHLESVPVFLAAIHLFENKNLEIKIQ